MTSKLTIQSTKSIFTNIENDLYDEVFSNAIGTFFCPQILKYSKVISSDAVTKTTMRRQNRFKTQMKISKRESPALY